MTGGYPIRAAARLTGLSVDTLRAWERRYEAVVPERGDRGRVYTERQISRLKQLAALVAGGHAIGSIAALSDADLRRLRSGDDRETPAHGDTAIDLEGLLQAVRRYDLEATERHFDRVAVLLPPRALIFTVVLPVLRDIGQRWENGTVSPAHEHMVSAIIRNVLGGLLRVAPRPASAPRIVFATPANERHEFGILCGALLAASAGYAAVYLGPDLPASDISKAAATADARAIVLSGTSPGVDYSEMKSLTRLPERLAVWVGGARADDLRHAIGRRARLVATLEDFGGLLDHHAA